MLDPLHSVCVCVCVCPPFLGCVAVGPMRGTMGPVLVLRLRPLHWYMMQCAVCDHNYVHCTRCGPCTPTRCSARSLRRGLYTPNYTLTARRSAHWPLCAILSVVELCVFSRHKNVFCPECIGFASIAFGADSPNQAKGWWRGLGGLRL